MIRSIFVLLAVLSAACTFDRPNRPCAVDGDCLDNGVPGRCIAAPSGSSSWCAFPSSECPSGFEFGPLAGDGLAGECLASLPPDAGVDGGADAGRLDADVDAGCLPEICDGIDNDCDDTIDEGCMCTDGDTQSCGVDTGACETGTQTCSGGVWGTCAGAITPTPETCNNIDDDCDGATDEMLTQACGTDTGACVMGMQTCSAGDWGPCEGATDPTPEICNDLDDDCDGTTDESLARSCGTDVGDCVSGTETCTAGVWGSCIGEIGPMAEDCDGGDENCNGMIDDGCACMNGTMQGCGTDVGACVAGTQTCSGGAWGACVGEIGPITETCNGVDDDCDLSTDEDFALGAVCDGPDGDLCNEGITICNMAGDGVTCNDATGTNGEFCNGADDDCDGSIDEDYALGAPCDGADADLCAEGMTICNATGTGTTCDDSTADTIEVCNGDDDDCDMMIDEGCPAAVTLRAPWNGYATGSVWATAAGLSVKPRRPTFRWNSVATATSYEIEVDDSCTTSGFTSCGFPSPEVDTATLTTSFTPTTDLPVATTAPVGRRYFWRVRACNSVGCSAWSTPRYLDVGRQIDDFNGDGYAEVLVGAYQNDTAGPGAGRAYVYLGGSGATFNTSSDLTINGATAGDSFGWAVAPMGDLNADGYADFAVGADIDDSAGFSGGRVYVYFGASTLNASADGIMTAEAAGDLFGYAVAGADFNGDGYSDVVVGAPTSAGGGVNSGRIYIFNGAAGLTFNNVADATLTGSAGEQFGNAVASAGDVNGDGYPDLIAGASSNSVGGRAYVHFGGATGPDTTIDGTMSGAAAGDGFGYSVSSIGDANADGYADVIVGAPGNDAGGSGAGRAYVYFGGSGAFNTTADGTMTGTAAGDNLGYAVSGAGDVNNDGYADAIVGLPFNDAGGMNAGQALIYLGGSGTSFNTTSDATLTGAAGDTFGNAVSTSGDANGDGYGDVIVGAQSSDAGGIDSGRAYVYFGGSGTFSTTSDGTMTGAAPGDFFGISVASLDDEICWNRSSRS